MSSWHCLKKWSPNAQWVAVAGTRPHVTHLAAPFGKECPSSV